MPRITQGTCIADRYVVEGVLGEGGLGLVLAVRDLVTGASLALKLLKAKTANDAIATARFIREARTMMSLRSEHIVRVLDAGRWRGRSFFVMERLEGESLHAHLKRGRLCPRDASDIAIQICLALAEAHARGIVHRDVTPANVFLVRAPDGSFIAKLLDFGISKAGTALGEKDLSLTATGTMLGSPRYMSPEQIGDAKRVDVRTDIWSLGAVLYRAVAGTDAFAGCSMVSVVCAILNEPYRTIASRGVAVAHGFEAIIGRCLERVVERRFRDVAELAEALSPFASGTSAAAVPRIRRALQTHAHEAFDVTLPFTPPPEVERLRAQRSEVTRRIRHPKPRRWELALSVAASVALFSASLALIASIAAN